MNYDENIHAYEVQIKTIEQDQYWKNQRKDRHGVMDCSADLRELEAEQRGYIKGYNEGLAVKLGL